MKNMRKIIVKKTSQSTQNLLPNYTFYHAYVKKYVLAEKFR